MLTKPTPLPSANPSPEETLQENRRRQQRGTGFTNIDRILGANQGAGQKIGESLGGSLSNQAGQVKQQINQGQSDFQAGMQQGSQNANSAIQTGKSIQKNLGETPEAYAARLAQANQAQLETQGANLQNARYSGPEGITDASRIQSQAGNVGALGKLAGTNAGQSQLLRSQIADRGKYTQGENALDQLLLAKEGQKAIQQGRAAVGGLNQQAIGAVQNAQNQAAANASSIENNKVKILHDLQNQLSGDEGFISQAKKQSDDYNKNAKRISEILLGKMDDGSDLSQLSDSDKDLLDHMQEYGIDPQMIYDKDKASADQGVKTLGSSVLQNFGGQRYIGDQSVAAQNLASFLQQKDTRDQISKNKFDTDLFSGDQKAIFGDNEGKAKYDFETRDILQNYANQLKTSEEEAKGNYKRLQDVILPQVNAANGKPIELLGTDKKLYDRYLAPRSHMFGGDQEWDTAFGDWKRFQGLGEHDNFMGNNGVGSLASGLLDQGLSPDDASTAGTGGIGRFAGLGLDRWAPGHGSAPIRSSDDLQDAANRSAGTLSDLKQYVLNRYLKGQV